MDDVKQSVVITPTEYLELKDFVKKQMTSILDKIDRDMKKNGVKRMLDDMTPKEKMDYVMDVITDYAKITENDIRLQKKVKRYVKYAKIACYILSEYLHLSLADISSRLAYKRHSNAWYHRNVVKGYFDINDKDNDIFIETNEILKRLNLKQ